MSGASFRMGAIRDSISSWARSLAAVSKGGKETPNTVGNRVWLVGQMKEEQKKKKRDEKKKKIREVFYLLFLLNHSYYYGYVAEPPAMDGCKSNIKIDDSA